MRQRAQVAWLKVEQNTIISIDTNIIITNYRIFLIPDELERKWVLYIQDVQVSDKVSSRAARAQFAASFCGNSQSRELKTAKLATQRANCKELEASFNARFVNCGASRRKVRRSFLHSGFYCLAFSCKITPFEFEITKTI